MNANDNHETESIHTEIITKNSDLIVEITDTLDIYLEQTNPPAPSLSVIDTEHVTQWLGYDIPTSGNPAYVHGLTVKMTAGTKTLTAMIPEMVVTSPHEARERNTLKPTITARFHDPLPPVPGKGRNTYRLHPVIVNEGYRRLTEDEKNILTVVVSHALDNREDSYILTAHEVAQKVTDYENQERTLDFEY